MKKQRKWTALGRRSMAFLLAAVMVMGCWTPGYAAEEELAAEELVQETAPDTSAPVESTEPAQEEPAEVPAEEPEEEPAEVPAEEPEEEPAEQKKTSAVADILKKVSGVVDLPKEEIKTTVEAPADEIVVNEHGVAEQVIGGEVKPAKTKAVNYVDGLTAVTTLDGRSFHLIMERNNYAVMATEATNTAGSHSGLLANTDANNAYYAAVIGKLNIDTLTRWSFESTGNAGEYYVSAQTESGKKYMSFLGDTTVDTKRAILSDTPVATKVYSYTYKTSETVSGTTTETTHVVYIFEQTAADGKTYVLNQLGGNYPKFNVFGGFIDGDAYKEDDGNFYLLKETYTETEAKPIQAVEENIKMNLFDYGPGINTYLKDSTYLSFFHAASYGTDALDGAYSKSNGSTAPLMKKTLGNDKYPYSETEKLSYAFLFDPSKATVTEEQYWADIYPENDVNVSATPYNYQMAAFPVDNADGTGTGLFQKDANGYYYYDSALNAAWYNPESNKFELYDYVLRPPYTAYGGEGSASTGNFLPFNQGHTTGYEDYGKTKTNDPSVAPVKPDGATTAYRLAGMSQATDANLWFGMALEFDFNMPEGGLMDGAPMEFKFHGDDDVYVYIDDVLVLDIGGTHGASSATINFATGAVTNPENLNSDGSVGSHLTNRLKSGTLYSIMSAAGVPDSEFVDINNDGTLDTFKDWSKHNLKFYYLERGGNISYCRLQFNMEPLPDGSALVSKELDSNSVITAEAADDDYTFKLVKVVNGVEVPVGGAIYTVGSGAPQKTVAEGENVGTFTLKAGETAAFAELDSDNNGQKYRVYEIDGASFHLSNANYSGSAASAGVVKQDGVIQYVEFTVKPDDASNGITHSAVFVNMLETTDFSVHKTVKGNMGDWSKEFTFNATLYTDDPAKGGTKIDFDEDGVWVDGVATFTLKHDESKSFSNIPLGAYVVITEANEEYVTSWVVGKENPTEYVNKGATATLTTDLEEGNDKAYFLNVKDVTIDTGVFLDSVPYILILAGVVAGAAWLVLRRRNSHEE